MDKQIAKIQFRQDTLANWNAINPIISKGEPIYVIDTKSFKIGDGETHFKDLPVLSTDSLIDEPTADGKLYARVRDVNADGGHWVEIEIPVVDTRKNFNDIFQAEPKQEIDMGFTIQVNGHTKKVFGIRKQVGNITLDATDPIYDKIFMTHIYSIVDIKGTFDCGHDYTYQINSSNLECTTFTYVKDETAHFVVSLNDTNRQIHNGFAEFFVMYTKVDDEEDVIPPSGLPSPEPEGPGFPEDNG